MGLRDRYYSFYSRDRTSILSIISNTYGRNSEFGSISVIYSANTICSIYMSTVSLK